MRWKSVAIVGLFLMTSLSEGAEALEVHLCEQRILTLPLSKDHLTRVGVEDDRIQKLFGETEDLVLETDEDHGQLFLKIRGGEPVYITLVTESGVTQELKLIPKSKEPEPVLLVKRSQQSSNMPKPNLNPPQVLVGMLLDLRRLQTSLPQALFSTPSPRLDTLRRPISSTLRGVLRIERLYEHDQDGVRKHIDRVHYNGCEPLTLRPHALSCSNTQEKGARRNCAHVKKGFKS